MRHLTILAMLLLSIGTPRLRAQSPVTPPTANPPAESAAPPAAQADITSPTPIAAPAATNATSHDPQSTPDATADPTPETTVLRDPFWPIGYEPPPPEPELSEAEIQQARHQEEVKKKVKWPTLHLSGITQAGEGRYLAIIKEIGVVEEGQTVSLRRGDIVYSWFIKGVSRQGVDFSRRKARPYRQQTTGDRTP